MTEGAAFPHDPFVIVVESNPDEMYKISAALKQHDFRVLGVMDGAGLTRSLERELPDVVVMDMHLAADNGHDILNRLKADIKTKHIKVIAVTTADEEDRFWAEGADDMLKKPLDPKRIIVALERLLGRE